MNHLPKHEKVELLVKSSSGSETVIKETYENCSFIISGDNIIIMEYGDDNTMVGTPYNIDKIKSYKVFENDITKNQLNG